MIKIIFVWNQLILETWDSGHVWVGETKAGRVEGAVSGKISSSFGSVRKKWLTLDNICFYNSYNKENLYCVTLT